MNSIPKRLPRRFAVAVDPHLTFVYLFEKSVVRQTEIYDISIIRCPTYNSGVHGEIVMEETSPPPFFSVEQIIINQQPIPIKLCITPLLYCIPRYREYGRQVFPVVLIDDFVSIQRELPSYPSYIDNIMPSSEAWRIKDLIRYLLQQFDDISLPDQRRWPNGLIPYPTDANFDFIEYPNAYYFADDESQSPFIQRRPPTPPAPKEKEEKAKEEQQKPSERVAGALARDSIQQGEICPITQEPLKPTKIGVTGCLCVFQGEALEEYKGNTCPSCRTPLTVRYIKIQSKSEAIN